MSGNRGRRPPRVVHAGPAGERLGDVVGLEPGIALVRLSRGTVRASFGAGLLASVARDPAAAPRLGDRVRLWIWCDDRVTLEEVVSRAVAELPPE
jgi:hypothetical protein